MLPWDEPSASLSFPEDHRMRKFRIIKDSWNKPLSTFALIRNQGEGTITLQ
jgi:hypothetical protein